MSEIGFINVSTVENGISAYQIVLDTEKLITFRNFLKTSANNNP